MMGHRRKCRTTAVSNEPRASMYSDVWLPARVKFRKQCSNSHPCSVRSYLVLISMHSLPKGWEHIPHTLQQLFIVSLVATSPDPGHTYTFSGQGL